MWSGSGAGQVRVLGVGEEDPEGGPSTRAVLDPGAAAVQAGELGDQGQADAGAGGVVGDVAALVEGLKDPFAKLGRYAGSLVFDQQQDAVVLGTQPDPDGGPHWGVLGRIDEQVLDDSLQLGGVGGQSKRWGVDHHRVLIPHAGVLHHPLHQGADVDQLATRGERAAGEPVQIQQVAEEPIQLAGVARQPMQQVSEVRSWQAGGVVLQGEGDAKDSRQGCAEIVGDRLQEGRLHLVHRSQVLGGGPFAFQGGGELVGGLLLAVQRLSQVVGGQGGWR